jgi:thiamine biosynthesis lipoprotein
VVVGYWLGAKSATVLGPDGGLTDALATALMVAGEDGAGWFAQPELAEYSAWVIDRHSGGAWGVGPAIT